MQVCFTIIVHMHAAIGMLVQISSQDNILFNCGQIVAWLVACPMCMYGFVGMIYWHTVTTKSIQEFIFIIKVGSGCVHDYPTVRNSNDMIMYSLDLLQHGLYRLAGLLKLVSTSELMEIVAMAWWQSMIVEL